MHSILIAAVLIISLVAKVEAGDLIAAGIASGFGKGLANSLSMMQAGMMQQALMQEQARLEQERMVQLQRYQLERDKLQHQRELERQRTVYGQPESQGISGQPTQNQARERDEATRRLEVIHPDWRQVIAPGTPYRHWLATQPASYQQLINATGDPAVLIASIDQFRIAQQLESTQGVEREFQVLWQEHAQLQQEESILDAMPKSSDKQRALAAYNDRVNSYHDRLDAYYVKVGQPSLAERGRAHFEELAKRVQRLRAQQEQAELGVNGH